MKKLIAILFLTLFVFNLIGFKLVYYFLQQNADEQFIVLVDKHQFNTHDLVEIKIPNPIPYTKAVANFDRVDGEISYKNKVYKYVYRKIGASYITILCLPDANKTKLNNAEKKFESSINNLTQTQKNSKQNNKLVKVNLSDFDYFEFDFTFTNLAKNINKNLVYHNYTLKFQPQKVALQPPKNILLNPIV